MLTTIQKIGLARLAYHGVMLIRGRTGGSQTVQVRRRGVRWALDLGEGIDLSIYLLHQFEWATYRAYRNLIRPDDVVVDIGANIGAHTLPLATLVGPKGKVFAFEPTDFASRKLIANITLNPNLAPRIVPLRMMLESCAGTRMSPAVYSSWPLGSLDGTHTVHCGRLMSTTGAERSTLDDAVAKLGITRIDLMKVDVDGNEHAVLAGGIQTLRRYMPRIIMELAPSCFDDKPEEFDGLLRILDKLGYSIFRLRTGETLPMDISALKRIIPQGCSCNVIVRKR